MGCNKTCTVLILTQPGGVLLMNHLADNILGNTDWKCYGLMTQQTGIHFITSGCRRHRGAEIGCKRGKDCQIWALLLWIGAVDQM